MAASWAGFIVSYPEFKDADPALGAAKLAEAQRQINLPLWGPLADDGVYLLTAQKLALSPFGNSAKLSTTDGRTVYDAELDRLRLDVSSGYRAT